MTDKATIQAHTGIVVYLKRTGDPDPSVDAHSGCVIVLPENADQKILERAFDEVAAWREMRERERKEERPRMRY